MQKFILGKKLGMSQVFAEDGTVIPVTLIEAGPVVVTHVRSQDADGYEAVQVAFGSRKAVSKPLRGHLVKAQAGNVRWLKEFRIDKKHEARSKEQDNIAHEVGQKIDASVFQEGDTVKVSGVSKGKGFQGVVKRHGFHGASSTHGVKHAHRQPGSIGATTPQRVWKGRKMAGRMGHERVSVKNLKIVKVDKEKGLLMVKGAVPGARGTLLEIRG